MPSVPRGTLLAALFATACGENVVTFELPPLEGARSAIFAFHGPDSFEARAVDLDDAIAVSFPVDLDPDAEGKIEALGFAASLGELGLSSGRIDIIDEGKPLRQHDQLFVLDFRGDEGSWVEGTERSEEVDAVKIPFDRDCTVLEVVESFPIESRSDHAFMLSLGEERALIAQTDGAM